MSDLRELLRQAAGDPPATLPMGAIRRRGAVLARRRRVTAAVATLAALLIVAAAAATTYRSLPSTPPARPAPTPVITAGALPPGTYTDRALNPPVTFTVDEETPWRVALATPTGLTLASGSLAAGVSVQHWTSVYPPVTGSGPAPAASPPPPDVITWLARHPALRITSRPAATLLGGQPAHRLTVTVNPNRPLATGPTLGCKAARDCLLLADTPDLPLVAYPDAAMTVIAPDSNPTKLTVTITAPANNLAKAAQIVDTFTFHP
jgi:hypothetical protein